MTIILSIIVLILVARWLVLEYKVGYYEALACRLRHTPAIQSLSFITLLMMVFMRIPVKDTDPGWVDPVPEDEEEGSE
jgi:hypothetical protein